VVHDPDGQNHHLSRLKNAHEALGERPRIVPIARIEGRLPAASLLLAKFHLIAGAFQNSRSIQPHPGHQLVDKAWDEERDLHWAELLRVLRLLTEKLVIFLRICAAQIVYAVPRRDCPAICGRDCHLQAVNYRDPSKLQSEVEKK
jgi:hypothetical protein